MPFSFCFEVRNWVSCMTVSMSGCTKHQQDSHPASPPKLRFSLHVHLGWDFHYLSVLVEIFTSEGRKEEPTPTNADARLGSIRIVQQQIECRWLHIPFVKYNVMSNQSRADTVWTQALVGEECRVSRYLSSFVWPYCRKFIPVLLQQNLFHAVVF